MLARAGIPQPERRVDDYPHQFSGGMRQRAMIAMALVNNPSLLIADEPTTALDVTVQAQILDLIRDLQVEFGSAVIIITHDLGVVAELADDILVMYAGRCMEYDRAQKVFTAPEHPYTWGLLASMPRLDREVRDRSSRSTARRRASSTRRPAARSTRGARTSARRHPMHHSGPPAAPPRHRRGRLPHSAYGPDPDLLRGGAADAMTEPPLLEVTGLVKHFPILKGLLRRQVGAVRAVDGLDFTVQSGETLGLGRRVGLRKTTTGRLVSRLLEPTSGADHAWAGATSPTCPGRPAAGRRDVQMIFQDPVLVAEPAAHGRRDRGRPFTVQKVETPHGTKRAVQDLLAWSG
jgi:ABC-type glutathione transport system ATPase component